MAASQIVPQVVPFPQSVPAVQISQLELIALLSLRNRLAQLEQQVESAEECIKARLQAGAAVEPGVYTAEVKDAGRRNVAWKSVAARLAKKLGYDPVAYCARVLAGTKPTPGFRLDVH
jgi:hypothetical protein